MVIFATILLILLALCTIAVLLYYKPNIYMTTVVLTSYSLLVITITAPAWRNLLNL